jgi:hypothetical protein
MKKIAPLILHLSLLACLFADYYLQNEGFGRIAQVSYWFFIILGFLGFFFTSNPVALPSKAKHHTLFILYFITFISLIYCDWMYTGILYIVVFGSMSISQKIRYKEEE